MERKKQKSEKGKVEKTTGKKGTSNRNWKCKKEDYCPDIASLPRSKKGKRGGIQALPQEKNKGDTREKEEIHNRRKEKIQRESSSSPYMLKQPLHFAMWLFAKFYLSGRR